MDNTKKTIHVVRALVKISSALNDMDNILDDSKLSNDIKKYLPILQEKTDELIKEPMRTLFKSDDAVLGYLIEVFDKFSENVFIRDSYCTSINLTLAKLESSLQDLEKLNYDGSYIGALKLHLKTFINKPFFKSYKIWVDNNGVDYNGLINELNIITEEVVIIENPIKND